MRRQEAREEAAIAAAAALGLNVSAELVLKPGQFKGDVTAGLATNSIFFCFLFVKTH